MSKSIKLKNDIYLDSTSVNKSAILVSLSQNATITSNEGWSWLKIPFDKVISKIGNDFSLVDGMVVCNKSNVRVKVTLHVYMVSAPSSAYPSVSIGNYYGQYQEYAATGIVNALEIGTLNKNWNVRGFIRPSFTGEATIKGTYLYTYMLVEEL
jgi:hypothetical protein|nr:MAG TPA: hypothetical protein [Caudoviricetes sp.]